MNAVTDGEQIAAWQTHQRVTTPPRTKRIPPLSDASTPGQPVTLVHAGPDRFLPDAALFGQIVGQKTHRLLHEV